MLKYKQKYDDMGKLSALKLFYHNFIVFRNAAFNLFQFIVKSIRVKQSTFKLS